MSYDLGQVLGQDREINPLRRGWKSVLEEEDKTVVRGGKQAFCCCHKSMGPIFSRPLVRGTMGVRHPASYRGSLWKSIMPEFGEQREGTFSLAIQTRDDCKWLSVASPHFVLPEQRMSLCFPWVHVGVPATTRVVELGKPRLVCIGSFFKVRISKAPFSLKCQLLFEKEQCGNHHTYI